MSAATAAMAAVERIASSDVMRIDVGMAFSASQGVVRTVTLHERTYSSCGRGTYSVVVENLSIEGADESVPALLRALADLLEASKP